MLNHSPMVLRLAAFAALLLPPLSWAGDSGTGWLELRTAHVTLKTDLSEEQAVQGVILAERIRNALLAGAWPNAKLVQPERIEMIVYADHTDFERHFGDFVTGEFVRVDYPPTLFLYGTPEKWQRRLTLAREETTSILRHEMVHHLAAFFFRREPRWFAEGFAQFLETMRFSEDGQSVILGDINLDAVAKYNRNRTVTVDEALAWGQSYNPQDQASILGLYGLSWLMVHWLNNTHGAEYERFQSLLNRGVDPDKAWKVVFPTLTSTDLAKQLNAFVHDGDYRNTTVRIPEVEIHVSKHPMTVAEVHATKAFTSLVAAGGVPGSGQAKEALRELAAALTADPGNVRALRLQMPLLKPADRVAAGRRATAAHPEDGLAWLTLGEALQNNGDSWDEIQMSYRKTMELLPEHPTAFNNLAWMDVQRGKAKEGLPLAVAAMQLAPWDSAILDTLAAALVGLGRCSEAVPTQARALDMLGENASAARRAEYAARLVSVKKKCADMEAAAAAAPAAPLAAPEPAAKP